jgi:hypothetical protein
MDVDHHREVIPVLGSSRFPHIERHTICPVNIHPVLPTLTLNVHRYSSVSRLTFISHADDRGLLDTDRTEVPGVVQWLGIPVLGSLVELLGSSPAEVAQGRLDVRDSSEEMDRGERRVADERLPSQWCARRGDGQIMQRRCPVRRRVRRTISSEPLTA